MFIILEIFLHKLRSLIFRGLYGKKQSLKSFFSHSNNIVSQLKMFSSYNSI